MIIGLCDDEKVQLDYIKLVIQQWAEKRKTSCKIESFFSAEEFQFEYQDHYPFDLLILDIQMDKINGMDLAKKIRVVDKNIPIIFLTGIPDYVFDGYEVGALRYLLKPVKEDQLYLALDDIFLKRKDKELDYYILSYGGEKIKIDYEDILCIESLGHYLKMTTRDNTYEWKASLGQLVKELQEGSFFNLHRSYVVNLRHVEKINKTDCLLSNGVTIPISRNHYQRFNESFIKYYRGDGIG